MSSAAFKDTYVPQQTPEWQSEYVNYHTIEKFVLNIPRNRAPTNNHTVYDIYAFFNAATEALTQAKAENGTANNSNNNKNNQSPNLTATNSATFTSNDLPAASIGADQQQQQQYSFETDLFAEVPNQKQLRRRNNYTPFASSLADEHHHHDSANAFVSSSASFPDHFSATHYIDDTMRFLHMLEEELNKVNKFYAAREAEYEHYHTQLLEQYAIVTGSVAPLATSSTASPSAADEMAMSLPDSAATSTSFDVKSTKTSSSSSNSNAAGNAHFLNPSMANGVTSSTTGSFTESMFSGQHQESVADSTATNDTNGKKKVTFQLFNKVKKSSTGKNSLSSPHEFAHRSALYFKTQRSKKVLATSFAENYRALSLLKNYRLLCFTAVIELLRLFDKITGNTITKHFSHSILKKQDFYTRLDYLRKLKRETRECIQLLVGDKAGAEKIVRKTSKKKQDHKKKNL